MHRKTAGALVAAVLALGVLASAILAARQIQADTVVPGFATAHINLEITVCDTEELEVEAKFTPPTGKRYYFKKRAFPLSPGLNTIEWYIRKIPAGQYQLTVLSREGLPLPELEDIYLTADKVNERKTFSVYICEPPLPEPVIEATVEPVWPAADEPHDPYPQLDSYSSSGPNTTGGDSTLNLPIAPSEQGQF